LGGEGLYLLEGVVERKGELGLEMKNCKVMN
jgi:hypothetical protein